MRCHTVHKAGVATLRRTATACARSPRTGRRKRPPRPLVRQYACASTFLCTTASACSARRRSLDHRFPGEIFSRVTLPRARQLSEWTAVPRTAHLPVPSKPHGPPAFDNAVSTASATAKGIDSSVAGRADILLMPNLEAGNALYKSLVYMAGASCAGVVLGTKRPVVLTSRTDSLESKVYSAALASVLLRDECTP